MRIIREQKGYSEGFLAANLGVSQNAYSKVGLGQGILTIERFFQNAMILETDISKLCQQGMLENYNSDKSNVSP